MAGGFYEADLAAIHAEGYAATYASGFDWMAERITAPQAAPYGGRLFDVGCGDGTWLAAASARGIARAGCDVSAAMVARARARGLEVSRASAQVVDLPGDTTHLTALGEVLCYVQPDAPHPVWSALAHFAAAPHLGWMAFDLIGPEVPETGGAASGAGWAYRSEVTRRGDLLTRHIVLTRDGRAREEVHHQRITTPEDVVARLEGLGFAARILTTYGPAPMLPGRFAVEAWRR